LTRQLISVISLLSQDTPDINSPANVDAARGGERVKEVYQFSFLSI
jgi:ubiquitin-protein ligase